MNYQILGKTSSVVVVVVAPVVVVVVVLLLLQAIISVSSILVFYLGWFLVGIPLCEHAFVFHI